MLFCLFSTTSSFSPSAFSSSGNRASFSLHCFFPASLSLPLPPQPSRFCDPLWASCFTKAAAIVSCRHGDPPVFFPLSCQMLKANFSGSLCSHLIREVTDTTTAFEAITSNNFLLKRPIAGGGILHLETKATDRKRTLTTAQTEAVRKWNL